MFIIQVSQRAYSDLADWNQSMSQSADQDASSPHHVHFGGDHQLFWQNKWILDVPTDIDSLSYREFLSRIPTSGLVVDKDFFGKSWMRKPVNMS